MEQILISLGSAIAAAVLTAVSTVKIHSYRIEEISKRIDKLDVFQTEMRDLKIEITEFRARIEVKLEMITAQFGRQNEEILQHLKSGDE